ncbi:MAG TPA: hypothetical protein VFS87_05510 [Qipengyuania sp.]|nr:hypothetical protein [Qipengyuania sp.]
MTKTRTPPAWRRAFLRELARSGSVRLAAEACGVDRTYPYQLRKRNAAFAASWERALAAAGVRLQAGSPPRRGGDGGGGARPTGLASTLAPVTPTQPSPERGRAFGGDRPMERDRPILRPNQMIRSSKTGKCCIMEVGPGRWSAAKEAVFLAELTASANVKAAARAAGVSTVVVYNRRKLWPAFKAEWDAALAEGHARIETLLVCTATNILDPEPLPERAWEGPEMSVEQALKLHLAHLALKRGDKRRLGGPHRREPDIEEVRQEILRKVAAMERAGMFDE